MNYTHLKPRRSRPARHFGVYVERSRLLSAAKQVCPGWAEELFRAAHPFGGPCFLAFAPLPGGGFEPAYVVVDSTHCCGQRLFFEQPPGLADAVMTDADWLAVRADREQAERLARQEIPGFATIDDGRAAVA